MDSDPNLVSVPTPHYMYMQSKRVIVARAEVITA